MPAPKDPIKYAEYCRNIGLGHKGKKQSPECIAKRVATRKRNAKSNPAKGRKRPPRSEEWSKNISLGRMGKIPWNKGLKMGPMPMEWRKNISIANLGKPKPPFTVQHRENIRKVMLGPANARRGAKHSIKTINAIKLARSFQKLPMKDSKPELMFQLGLTLHGIKFEKHKSITDGQGFYHQVDVFIKPNICVEIDGDYWHANPKKYCPDYIIKTRKNLIVNAKDIWIRDTLVNNKLKQLGYEIMRTWESDIKNNPQKEILGVLQLIKKESV